MAIFSRKPKPIAAAASTAPAPIFAATHGSVASGALEPRIQDIGRDMLDRARTHSSGVLSAKFYSDKLMDWSMKDQNFKVQLFRFVDAFPMLRTPEDIFDHLADYLSQPGVKVPAAIDLGLKAGGIAKGLATRTITSQIEGMASKFIVGADAASALPNLKSLWSDGIAFSVDLLGEACVSDAEAEHYQRKYLDLVSNLPAQVAGWKRDPRLESDHLGPVPRTNVSIKISALSARVDPIDTEGSIRDLMKRIVPILEVARDKGVFVNFDMEQFALKDLTLELFMRCCEAVGGGDFQAGLAMQAYLRSGEDDARRICEWAKRTGRIVTVRLVKGAYWDFQVIHAEQMGWPCPVWPTKRETDACFERMTEIFLDACPRPSNEPRASASGPSAAATSDSSLGTRHPALGTSSPSGVKLALGSHNVRSIAAALAALESRGLPHAAIEIQMLHGMADQLKHAAADMGLRIREYVPVGDMIPGMAYLVRRLLENTSNESWLKAGFLDNADPAALLASPHQHRPEQRPEQRPGRKPGHVHDQHEHNVHTPDTLNPTRHSELSTPDSHPRIPLELGGRSTGLSPERHALSASDPRVGDGRPFFNESFRDFSIASVRTAFAAAVNSARVPTIANDRTPDHGAAMLAKAAAVQEQWGEGEAALRSQVLVRAAAAMRARRDELSGVMIKEAGKTWREADADTCEAIDFCEYYARQAMQLFRRSRLGAFIGELDETWYQPRGVAVVIAPWNFPLAICTGMTTAALVTGNPVIVKPAEQTPGIARLMCDILWDALKKSGGPADALQFCPAPGETTGAFLVRDPRVAVVAFTGSRDVGLDILSAAAPASPFSSSAHATAGQRTHAHSHIKKVIAEMGGKNALIIDTSADLDEAILAVRQSAFGFQGQKCSACSRLIVVDPAGERGPAIRNVITRLVEATKALVIGDPTLPGTDVGPVIDAEAAAKIRGYVQKAKDEGCTIELAMEVPGASAPSTQHRAPSTFVGPHIFSGVTPTHRIAKEEIFGPVLAVMHAATFEDALRIANDSPYKLTGGVFSRRPAHLEMAKRGFRVGNLYLNRGITGALVGRQPFGGFGMSGVGSKAGGADYLLQFVEPRASCENTMRRGFAPEL